VYTRLVSPGADRKRVGEAAIRESSIAYTILRPSMIYGTHADRNIARLLRWVRAFPVVPVPGGGVTLQQPVHVEDLVDAIVNALDRPESARREYDLGGPEALPLSQLIRICGDALGRRVFLLPIPLAPAFGAMRLLRLFRLPAPVRPEQILRLAESKAVDIGPARRDLGFAPRGLVEGIQIEVKDLPPRSRP
jgi:nucleoside-diphosphate-sugar epimerase